MEQGKGRARLRGESRVMEEPRIVGLLYGACHHFMLEMKRKTCK
jgi:hypothetical protein